MGLGADLFNLSEACKEVASLWACIDSQMQRIFFGVCQSAICFSIRWGHFLNQLSVHRQIEECLERNPPFSDYVSAMTPLPHINAVGNAGFTDPEFIPSVPVSADLMYSMNVYGDLSPSLYIHMYIYTYYIYI